MLIRNANFGMIKPIVNRLEQLRYAIGASLRKRRKGTDYRRWGGSSALSRSWDSRTEQIGLMIQPGSSVLEFGAGRMVLRDFLPDGCSYTPSDLVDRGSGTVVYDLNSENLPDFRIQYDVAVFGGVLEYIDDVPRLVAHLSTFVHTIIASYAVTDHNPNKIRRRCRGWVNHYSSEEFKNVFLQHALHLEDVRNWHSQRIFRFVRD